MKVLCGRHDPPAPMTYVPAMIPASASRSAQAGYRCECGAEVLHSAAKASRDGYLESTVTVVLRSGVVRTTQRERL